MKLDQLIKQNEKHFEITVVPMMVAQKFPAREVTVKTDLRTASIIFIDFWQPETVQANWDDLVEWVERRP